MRLIKKTASGMSLVELSAVMVVMSVIGLGLAYASQAIVFHYHNDQVRQEVRSYGNIIITEIAEELNKSQKVSIDGLNGFCIIIKYL
jgi:prepilin-type N-terminal cleavage/methylation domain-containing protein